MSFPTEDVLRERFTAARTALEMSQEETARALGVSSGTVSRWERGTQNLKARDVDALERLVEAKRRGETVPRGTYTPTGIVEVGGALPSRLESLARNFEREMIRAGATDDEIDYVHFATHNPESAKLFYMGGTGQPLSPEKQERELVLLLEALRVWVMTRVAEREAAERRKPRAKSAKPAES